VRAVVQALAVAAAVALAVWQKRPRAAAACARARGAAQLEHAGARSAPCVHLVELELEVDPVVEVVPAALWEDSVEAALVALWVCVSRRASASPIPVQMILRLQLFFNEVLCFTSMYSM
jgi:hypothetical protein